MLDNSKEFQGSELIPIGARICVDKFGEGILTGIAKSRQWPNKFKVMFIWSRIGYEIHGLIDCVDEITILM
tara:strand:- start:7477 stop:7689 length:213 start_codon:yes stop_codon:yes gene_type:complete